MDLILQRIGMNRVSKGVLLIYIIIIIIIIIIIKQSIMNGEYNLWTFHQGCESREEIFHFEMFNIERAHTHTHTRARTHTQSSIIIISSWYF